MNGLLEILTAKKWMISPDYLHGIQQALQQNLNGHLPFEAKDDIIRQQVFTLSEDGSISELCISAESGEALESSMFAGEVTEPFFNVLYISGPITRNGGGCSFGSIDYRDMMMTAAGNPLCMGHIFVINTPGGSAWAKNDFEQAIEYARSQKQPVLAFVDGMCCSAGMYLAALCDERYYMHPKDEIGCIGVMAAFYTEKSGEKNEYTNETYHELYDPESFDKNKSFRDIAQDDDDTLLIEELKTLGEEFRKDVKAHCPNAEDDHLHGKVFDAKDVEGILMDGQSTLMGCMDRIREIRKDNPVIVGTGVQMTNSNSNSNINMANYPLTQSAMGVEELVVTEEGTHIDASLLDTMEQNLQQKADEMAQLQEQIANLTKERDDAQAQVTELNGTLEGLNQQIADAEQKETDLNAKLAEQETKLGELNSQLKEKDSQLSALNSQLSDKDATIAELTTKAEEHEEAPSPENNGEGLEAPKMVVGAPKYNPALTPAENAKAMADYKASLQQKMSSKKSL